jgi:hypothetical protein
MSSERYYCEWCNQWMGGDPKTRKFHEQGRKHRDALKSFLIETRKRKVAVRRAEEDTARMLKQIDADAHRAMGVGVSSSTGVGVGAGVDAGVGAGAGAGAGHSVRGGAASFARDAERPRASADEGVEDGVGDGIYDVDGAYYLMGEHETSRSLLVEGTAVEVLRSGFEEWTPAQIVVLREAIVPFTKIVTRTVTVALMTGERVDLPAASLRVPLGDEAAAAALRGADRTSPPDDAVNLDAPPSAPIDEVTGLGKWAAVAVEPARKRARAIDAAGAVDTSGGDGHARVDDNTHELAHFHANPSKALDAAASLERRTNAALEAVDDDNRGDAFFTYNPYGGGTYKGIQLSAVVDLAAPPSATAARQTTAEPEGDGGWATVKVTSNAPPAANSATAPTASSAAPAPPAPAVEFKARGMSGGAVRVARKRLE